ncbi:unnamed protein product [Ectocarpus sp. CCAP 1310/34]|nr:unnamed protein product [Ectocarpus sp. CCAP 1310/34]
MAALADFGGKMDRGLGRRATADVLWDQIRKLRDCAPMEGEFYPDEEPAKALAAISVALKPWSSASRETLLSMYAKIADGKRLDDLISLFLGSQEHPALRYACLELLGFVGQLKQTHRRLLCRMDVIKTLLTVLERPRIVPISPYCPSNDICPAAEAARVLSVLCAAEGGLKGAHAEEWVSLGALGAISSALEFNAAIPDYFTDFPMVMFMISGVLLSEAGHAVSLDDRARVAETSLGLWVERRRWVAPYAGSLGSLFEGPLRGEALMRAPLELRNQAVKQAEDFIAEGFSLGGWAVRLVAAILSESPADGGGGGDGVAGNGDGGHEGAEGTVGAVTDSASATAGGVGPTSGVSGPVRPSGGKQVPSTRGHLNVVLSDIKRGADAAVLCSRETCGRRQGDVKEGFKRCGRCRTTVYCSKDCQVAHWKEKHKMECKKK